MVVTSWGICRCEKCCGSEVFAEDDGKPQPKEPITFHLDQPRKCICEGSEEENEPKNTRKTK